MSVKGRRPKGLTVRRASLGLEASKPTLPNEDHGDFALCNQGMDPEFNHTVFDP